MGQRYKVLPYSSNGTSLNTVMPFCKTDVAKCCGYSGHSSKLPIPDDNNLPFPKALSVGVLFPLSPQKFLSVWHKRCIETVTHIEDFKLFTQGSIEPTSRVNKPGGGFLHLSCVRSKLEAQQGAAVGCSR